MAKTAVNAPPVLSPRQCEVLRRAGTLGCTGPAFTLQAAAAMSVDPDTVSSHLLNASVPFGTTDTFSTICVALDKGTLTEAELANGCDLESLVARLDVNSVAFLREACKSALETRSLSYEEIARRWGWQSAYSVKELVKDVYAQLAPLVSNRAQMAVVAYHVYRAGVRKI